jgi:DNA-binding MarR family transcriptional regulator
MHTSNVVSAWVLEAGAALAGAAGAAGLDERRLAALTLVATHDGCSIDWLRRRIALTHSGAVRLVDRLADGGLLERTPVQGRSVALTLTPAGAGALARWRDERERALGPLLSALAPDERETLAGLLAAALERRGRGRPDADTLCRTCDWPACGADCPVDRSVAA